MDTFREQAPDVKRAQVLFEALKKISPEQAKQALDKKGIDPTVGIAVAEFSEMPPVKFEDQEYYLYAARVLPKRNDGKQPFVTPHEHHAGSEPYVFYGDGEMNFGRVSEDRKSVSWKEPVSVSSGSEILIDQAEVHSFRNTGEQPVDFLFACPKTHLKDFPGDPNGDRFIVKELEGGIPKHFPK